MKLRTVVDRLRDRASTIRQDNAVEDITDILRRLPDDEAHAVWLRVGFERRIGFDRRAVHDEGEVA